MNTMENQGNPTEAQLIACISSTYQAGTTQQVKANEQSVLMLMSRSPEVLGWMFKCMESTSHADLHFKQACINLIKNHFYAVAHTSVDKSVYISTAFDYLQLPGIRTSLKETLAIALQHILNQDLQNQYRSRLVEEIVKRLEQLNQDKWSLETMDIVWGLMASAIACMNSLVELEELLGYVKLVLPYVTAVAALALRFVRECENVEFFEVCRKSFEVIEIGLERLSDEEKDIEEQYLKLLGSQCLHSLLVSYLNAFNHEGSVVTSQPILNTLKESVLEFLFNIYRTKETPAGYLQIILSTFLVECKHKRQTMRLNDEENDQPEQIICRCMQILENHLRLKFRYDLFLNYKVEILFALFMYCRTMPDQEALIQNEPQKFVEIAEDFSAAVNHSNNLKIRAAGLIRAFVNNIDGGVRNVLELATIFLIGSLKGSSTETDEQLRRYSQDFSTFQFSNLQPWERIDISLMVLTIVAPDLTATPEECKVVQSVLSAHHETFMRMENKLLLMRLIHMIGYYPNTVFFFFIKQLMEENRAFLAQGICTFTRICRNQTYLSSFPMMHKVFKELLELVDVSDVLFDDLLGLNYKTILRGSDQLMEAVLEKLHSAFRMNLHMKGSIQKCIISLNHFEKLIENENRPLYEKKLENLINTMHNAASNVEILEENFVSVYLVLISNTVYVSDNAINFIVRMCERQKMQRFGKNTKLFALVNKFLTKCDQTEVIFKLYRELYEFVKIAADNTDLQNYNHSIIPKVCFTIGHVVLVTTNLSFSKEITGNLLKAAEKFDGHNHAWLMILFLHYLYRHTKVASEYFMRVGKYYQILLAIFRLEFHSMLERKIVVLCLSELIAQNLDIKLIIETIRFCTGVLLTQHSIYKQKPTKIVRKQKMNAKIRRMLIFQPQNQQSEDIGMDDDPKNFQNNDEFRRFKHPFSNRDQFVIFKKFVQNREEIRDNLDKRDLERLREVLSIEWFKNCTRKIVKIAPVAPRRVQSPYQLVSE